MEPTPIRAPESVDQGAAYDRLVERYSAPETLSAALERVTAEARRRAADREAAGDAADAGRERDPYGDRPRLQSLQGSGAADTKAYPASRAALAAAVTGTGRTPGPASIAPDFTTDRPARELRRYQLAIEALITTVAEPSQWAGMLPEHQRIGNLCRESKSVAEIAALLRMPLGVARILVADLVEGGFLDVHAPMATEAGNIPDVTLLERVLSGLRKL